MLLRPLQTLAFFCMLTTTLGQQVRERPTDLIEHLTKRPPVESLLGCGPVSEYRATATRLAALGMNATPAVDAALDSIERQGQQSDFAPNAGWLLLAYSRIEGTRAVPRLTRMLHANLLAFLGLELDEAMALALDITSYVDNRREAGAEFFCRRAEPRDALNQLIAAWLKNDRQGIESSLGPKARAALKSSLRSKTWPIMRAELWNKAKGDSAVGYRFEVSGRWSEPEETLSEIAETDPTQDRQGPKIETIFKSGSGADCGRHTIGFVGITTATVVGVAPSYPDTYRIDNSDILDLLRQISSCAAKL